MPLVNYLSRMQALDKVVALHVEGHLATLDHGGIVTIVNLERFRNQTTHVAEYAEWLAEMSACLVIVGCHEAHQRLAEVAREAKVTRLIVLDEVPRRDRLADKLIELLPNDASLAASFSYVGLRNDVDEVGPVLARRAVESGGRVLRYFKSVHDKDRGITADPAGLRSRWFKRGVLRVRDALAAPPETYLVYDDAGAAALRREGVPSSRIRPIMYPLHGQRWVQFLRTQAEAREIRKPGVLNVGLFVRGRIEGRPDTPESQVMPSSLLVQLLREIRQALDDLGESYRLLVKPHPNQAEEPFFEHVAEAGLREADIVHHPPGLICAAADLAISTYSSTCLDAVAFDIPTVDYYRPTPAFREIHPRGNRFDDYGVTVASTPEELRAFLGTQ